MTQLQEGWTLNPEGHLTVSYDFPNFLQALDFVNRVGKLAEDEGHHPDLQLGWGYCRITLWTHAIKGLSESDFILASKIDRLKTSDPTP